MNKYCVDLNLPIKLFNTDKSSIDFLKSKPIWANNVLTNRKLAHHFMLDVKNDLSQEIHEFFKSLNLVIFLTEVFYTYPNGVGSIHSDSHKTGDFTKLNWALSGKGVMKWYTLKDNQDSYINTTAINSHSIHYRESSVDVVHEQYVGQPSLVQVGCPHNIVNSNEERFCVSILFRDVYNNRLTMDQALETFKDYIGRA